jgi:glycosyltransferase involved in cell wall biosynthesis
MRPLKISMVGTRGIPATYSGIETALEELCPRLALKGHQIAVYARSDAENSQGSFKGVKIKRVPAINTKHLETFTRVTSSIWQEIFDQSDIVHFHALGPAAFSLIPRLFSKKTVVTVQGLDWQRKKWGWLARQFLKLGEYASARFPNATIVVSQVLKEYYDAKYGIRTTYIPNGVSIPVPKDANLIRKYGLARGNYILFASRLVPEKGCHYLVEAFKGLDTNKKLVLAGSSSHTDAYVEQLHALSRNHANIIFTGFVSGELLAELFSNAYLYVLPSEIEGLSLSLLEAMSYGLCVVTSDIPENVSVTQGTYGYSFRNQDVSHLREILAHLLQCPEKARLTGEKAREHASACYSWDHITEQTEAVYYSLLETK